MKNISNKLVLVIKASGLNTLTKLDVKVGQPFYCEIENRVVEVDSVLRTISYQGKALPVDYSLLGDFYVKLDLELLQPEKLIIHEAHSA